jgi:hypothetical protein
MRILFFVFCFSAKVLCGIEFTFTHGSNGWEGGFSDYPVNEEIFYELSWGWSNLPTCIENEKGKLLKKGIYLSGNNHSDDLFMFLKRKIHGCMPQRLYTLNIKVLIESNTPQHSIGIGGAPGESLFFKVGAATEEPSQLIENGFYFLNVDKGNQSCGGAHAQVIGNLANPAVDPQKPSYMPKFLETPMPLHVRADANGSFWIFLGTDSGFEGKTTFYVAQITLEMVPCEKN